MSQLPSLDLDGVTKSRTWSCRGARALRLSAAACLLAALTLSCGAAPTTTPSSAEEGLTEQRIESLSHGVFEVVMPKPHDPGMVYEEELPDDQLPYHVRTDKFTGVGTTFAIGPKRFVSAAHLFAVQVESLRNDYLVRDKTGKTHKLGKFKRYSQYRDIVEFELETYPDKVIPLAIAKEAPVGATVYAAGNALGEGIVVREGQVTSHTPEEAEGKWKHIRYSSPTSPGNSGGPLLNGKGEAVGIVIAKVATENLNYAVPIEELDKLSESKAEFYVKGGQSVESGKRHASDWRFAPPLPATYGELAKISRKAFYASLEARRKKLQEKHGKELFPKHPKLATWAREQTPKTSFGMVEIDGNGVWSDHHVELTAVPIGPDRTLWAAKDGSNFQLIVERPDDMSLKEFYDNPRAVHDVILKTLKWRRKYAGRQIRIVSYGEPQETDRWRDGLGRTWLTSVWRTEFDDKALVNLCLTYPRGLACVWGRVGIGLEMPYRNVMQRLAQRVSFSYGGRLKDWEEFLALPDEYVPTVLRKVEMKLTRGTLKVGAGPFKGSVRLPGLTDESVVTTYIEHEPLDVTKHRIVGLGVDPRKDKGWIYLINGFVKPLETNNDGYRKLYAKMDKREAPYDGKLVKRGKANAIKSVVKVPASRAGGVEHIFLYTCGSGAEDNVTQLTMDCARFRAGVRVKL